MNIIILYLDSQYMDMSNENLKGNEILQSDNDLDALLKEINELKDKDYSNDLIESGIIIDNNLKMIFGKK